MKSVGRSEKLVESASRWLASRTTRRSFLATTGKVAVVTAGGATLASVFASRAEARACGQSGVSPRCPTYDCVGDDVVWGWCWYASPGCCTNGGLKKICDCCKRNHPNVHGYCPDGHNVYCMVESCLEDPRLQKVALERSFAVDAADLSFARLVTRAAGSTPRLVIASADPLPAAMAGPLANRLGLPLLLTDPKALRPNVLDELRRLGVKGVTVVAHGISASVIDALVNTFEAKQVGTSPDVAVASVQVAVAQAEGRASTDAVCIGADAVSLDCAGSASSYAAVRNIPLLIGADAASAFRDETGKAGSTLLIGDSVADRSSSFSKSSVIRGNDPRAISLALATRLMDESYATHGIAFVSASSARVAVGYTPVGGPLIIHDDTVLTTELRDWVQANRIRLVVAECALGIPGSFDDTGVRELQGALNGFDRQFLRGDDDGVGLPVYAQPMEERPIGMVRVTGPLPSTSVPGVVPKPRHKNPIGFATPETAPPRTAPGAPTTTQPPPVTTTKPKGAKK